ncbi:MAG: dTDP-4-dehydrorhamnose reductase [Candidatus Hydrogenedentes bacterium]|nr:dTDP-4-dehydrorhamnose reductase [Candidatus Hydrogenedentota bacterium]
MRIRKMRVIVIGARGQLGTELCAVYGDTGLVPVDIDTLDVRNDAAVANLIQSAKPDLVINTAAAHNVAECENDPATAFAVNAAGARNVAVACAAVSARLVYISTDYIFSGDRPGIPLIETDLPGPRSVYAASKLAGEHLVAAECPDHLIIRSAAMYGCAPCIAKGGRNFVSLMTHLAATQPEVRVVNDQITTPTCAKALAAQIKLASEKAPPGVYHATCHGECSWYECAREIFDVLGIKTPLLPVATEDVPSTVQRPRYSVLKNKRLEDLGLDIMPHWKDALHEYLHLSTLH